MIPRRIARTPFIVGLSAVAVAVAATAAVAAAQASPPTWTPKQVIQYLPGTNHSKYDAVVVEPGQAWFFGGSNVGGAGVPVALLRKSGRWLQPSLPSGPHSWIVAASATSASNVWAVTHLGGTVVHWDGSTWHLVPNGGWSRRARFTGISAVGPSNVWLFGSPGGGLAGAGTWHLTPTGWQQMGGPAADLNQGGAAGPGDIWAIGGIGGPMNALVHFNGSAWRHVRPAALAGFRYSHVLTLSRRNVWVAGSVAGTPMLGHFDGSGWTAMRMPSSATVAATGMCRDGAGGLWVIANAGTSPSVVFHRTASGIWARRVQVSGNATNEVLACASVPRRRAAWGAGQAAARPGASGTAAAAYGTGNVP